MYSHTNPQTEPTVDESSSMAGWATVVLKKKEPTPKEKKEGGRGGRASFQMLMFLVQSLMYIVIEALMKNWLFWGHWSFNMLWKCV